MRPYFHVKKRDIKLKSTKAVAKTQLCEFQACSLSKKTPKTINTKTSLNQPDTALVFIVQQPEPLKILASG